MRRYITKYIRQRFSVLRSWLTRAERLYLARFCVGFILGTICADISIALWIFVMILPFIFTKKIFVIFYLGSCLGALHLINWVNSDPLAELVDNQVTISGQAISDADVGFYEQSVLLEAQDSKILLRAKPYPRISMGDYVEVEGELRSLLSELEGGYAEYLYSTGVRYILSSNTDILLRNESIPLLQKILKEMKNALITSVQRNLPEPNATLLLGLLVGKDDGFEPELESNLRNSGTSHIVAVSGYNVTIILVAIVSLAGVLPRRLLLILTAIGLVGYLYVVGLGNLPAKRAVIMGLLLLVSWYSGRKNFLPFALLYVIALMLWELPVVWRNVSFQLSVMALLGILIFTSRFQELFSRVPNIFSEILAASLAVMLSTMPVVLSTFGSLSLVSLPANLLILPIIPIATFVGIAAVGFSWILPFLSSILFWLTDILLDVVIGLINFFGSIPGVYSEQLEVNITIALILVFLYLFADIRRFRQNRQRYVFPLAHLIHVE